MKHNLDKKVAELLIKAQMCSDSGKHIWNTYGHSNWKSKADKFGYGHKVKLITAAMDRISQLHGTSGFSYYVGDDNYMDVVYFNFKYNYVPMQISFHVPEGIPSRYMKNNKSHRTKWDGKRGGSMEAVDFLSWYIG